MDDVEPTLDLLCRYLDEDDERYERCGLSPLLEQRIRGEVAHHHVLISARDEPTEVVAVHVLMPDIIPESRREQMAEAITRANWNLSIGSFKLNMTDGTLWYRTCIPTDGAVVTREQFGTLREAALWAVEHYYRAFSRLLYGDDLSPAEVIAEVEMADRIGEV